MAKQLGQESIDELFNAAQAGLGEAAAAPGSEAGPELYNFSRAGQISNEQMRAISTVNDLFARNLMHSLGVWLRTAFEVKLVGGVAVAAEQFERQTVAIQTLLNLTNVMRGGGAAMRVDISRRESVGEALRQFLSAVLACLRDQRIV